MRKPTEMECEGRAEGPLHQASHDSDYLQSSSPFFGRLPPEIRHQIYQSILETAGSTQHIYKTGIGYDATMSHTRCCIDPDGEDLREKNYLKTFNNMEEPGLSSDDNIRSQRVWRRRQYTDWCNHWECEEGDSTPNFSGPLLTCKRIYDEMMPLVYSSLTFSFINTPALLRFMVTTSAHALSQIRSIHLIWCCSTETNTDDGSHDASDDEAPDSLKSWQTVWERLAVACPRVTRVRVWIYDRFPRFPMPAPAYFQVLDAFADGTFPGSAPREMDNFTVQMMWTREFGSVTADEAVMHQDDGEVVPDWLRKRRFNVSRVPAAEYEPETWMAMWARPRALENAGHGLTALLKVQGWGIRGKKVDGE